MTLPPCDRVGTIWANVCSIGLARLIAKGPVIVFLLEPERTQYDLSWQMFGVPVRVHPMFWLVTAIMGWSSMTYGFQFLLLWIGCVFVSILIHELGHVFAFRWFGADAHVVLYSFGGLAIPRDTVRGRWQRIAVSFAGPWAGFVFLGVVIWLVFMLNPDLFATLVGYVKLTLGVLPEPDELHNLRGVFMQPTLVEKAVLNLFWINLFWGLLNLLPIYPLDGGQISRELLEGFVPDNGLRISLGLSGGLAALLAVNSLLAMNGRGIPFLPLGGLYMVLFFGMLALSSFQAMQQVPSGRPWREERPDPWDKDRDYWRDR